MGREIEAEDDAEPGVKRVKRTLFSRMNPFPQKKIMTFNKHVKDFTFNVNYAELEYLGETEVANIGSQNLTSVLVKGVKEALDGNLGDAIETKGVKAHFQLDDSGILTCTHVESVFEKTISPEEQEEKEKAWKEATDSIDWSKLGDNIKSFFGSDAEKKDESAEGEKKEDKPKEPKKPKVESVKVDLETEGSRNDLELLDGEGFDSSKAKLAALNQADLDRLAVETALNELQSFSFDLSDKMEDEEYMSASTTEERDSVLNECSKVSEWLDEEAGMFTPVDEFNTKLKVLKDLSAPVVARVREHKERPEALEQLRQSINSSNVFLEKSKEYLIKPKPKEPKVEQVIEPVVETPGGDGEKIEDENTKEAPEDSKKEDEKPKDTTEEKPKPAKKKTKIEDEGLFKEKELDSLKKKIAEVEKWRDDKLAEQAGTPLSEMPKLTVSMIKSKIQDLDSEVQFLIQKARMLKAEKEREKRKLEAEEKKAEEERLKKEKKAKKKKAKEANATETDEVTEEAPPSTESKGEGDSDTTEKKPGPVDEDNSAKDNVDETPEVPEEHTEL